MECALPVALAWVLHRKRHQPTHSELHEQQRTPSTLPGHQRSHPTAAGGGARLQGQHDTGSSSSSASSSSSSSCVAATRRQSVLTWLRSGSCFKRPWQLVHVSGSGLDMVAAEDVQRVLLHMALMQLLIRTGVWERLFRVVAVGGVHAAHKLSKRTLKLVLAPVLVGARRLCVWRRPRRHRTRTEGGAEPGHAPAGNAAAAAAPAGAAATGSTDPLNNSDLEDPNAASRRPRPPNVVIISRPRLLAPAGELVGSSSNLGDGSGIGLAESSGQAQAQVRAQVQVQAQAQAQALAQEMQAQQANSVGGAAIAEWRESLPGRAAAQGQAIPQGQAARQGQAEERGGAAVLVQDGAAGQGATVISRRSGGASTSGATVAAADAEVTGAEIAAGTAVTGAEAGAQAAGAQAAAQGPATAAAAAASAASARSYAASAMPNVIGGGGSMAGTQQRQVSSEIEGQGSSGSCVTAAESAFTDLTGSRVTVGEVHQASTPARAAAAAAAAASGLDSQDGMLFADSAASSSMQQRGLSGVRPSMMAALHAGAEPGGADDSEHAWLAALTHAVPGIAAAVAAAEAEAAERQATSAAPGAQPGAEGLAAGPGLLRPVLGLSVSQAHLHQSEGGQQGLAGEAGTSTDASDDAGSSCGSSTGPGPGAGPGPGSEAAALQLSDPALQPVVSRILGLPLCVSYEVLRQLDSDAKRVLRCVSRGLYFEASRHLCSLTIHEENLETLVYMPMHHVFPGLTSLTFRTGPAPPSAAASGLGIQAGADGPAGEDAPAAGAAAGAGALAPRDPAAGAFDVGLLCRLLRECLPHLHSLREVDLSDACLHANPVVWSSFLAGLPKAQPLTVRMREPTAWWARGLTVGLPGDGRDTRDHFPALLDAVQGLQSVAPLASVDLTGVTVRKHTAARLPQLCGLANVRQLSLFGKSAAAVPHGHRLASHLHCFAAMPHLTSLELLSYEDVSDGELAVLSGCPCLRHLYVDSLFIKHASGPVFPSITSLAAARIKFILQPLTTIFPNLTRLRLGVLHSELNKKINSASVSCLAGCSESLRELVVCPVLWKGQWQVLPTLPGLKKLSLVHCKDLSHLREVLRVVGRSPSLETVELQACSSFVPPWPGVVATGPAPAPNAAAFGAADGPGGGADGADFGGDASGSEGQVLGALSEGSNLLSGLSVCASLRELVVHDCTPTLVRHLAAASLPDLRTLSLEKMGPAMRLPDIQAAVLNLQGLTCLRIEEACSVSAAQAEQLPEALSRPSLSVQWRSSCTRPSLYTTRGFSEGDPKP